MSRKGDPIMPSRCADTPCSNNCRMSIFNIYLLALFNQRAHLEKWKLLPHKRVTFFKSSLTKTLKRCICAEISVNDAFRDFGCSKRAFSLNCLFKSRSSHEFQGRVNIVCHSGTDPKVAENERIHGTSGPIPLADQTFGFGPL